jgi:uncharacterized membrane protein YbaN (DUF454 family)
MKKPAAKLVFHDDSGTWLESEGGGVAVDERRGLVRAYEPRLFRADRRALCERILDAAAAHPAFRKGEVDIDAATCRLAFGPGLASVAALADAFADVVRRACSDSANVPRTAQGRWSVVATYRLDAGLSTWEIAMPRSGRIRLRSREPIPDSRQLTDLAAAFAEVDGVTRSRLVSRSHEVRIDYKRGSRLGDNVTETLEQILGALGSSAPGSTAAVPALVPSGPRRVLNLALAGGSFGMMLVALVVPGIPTVPFLLATGYYLARSSPWLDEKLRNSVFFGAILREWEQYHAVSRTSKNKLAGLTGTVVLVTALVAAFDPLTLLVVILMAALSLYGIGRMPEIAGAPTAAATPALSVS